MEVKLRPYQAEMVRVAVDALSSSTPQRPPILVGATAMGKSWVIAGICHELSKLDPEAKIIIFAPSKEILEQNAEKLELYGFDDIKVYSASCGRKEVGQYTMATIGSVKNHPELFKGTKYAIIDECVSGDTEVLTESGWIRFDQYDGVSKVAQWDNGKISFVYPEKFIKRKHIGEAYNVKLRNGKSVIMTPGHRQPLYYKKSGIIRTKTIEETKFNDNNLLFTSGMGTGNDALLTPLERLIIATQADGSLLHSAINHNLFYIGFAKERKVNRFLRLCKEAGVEPKETSGRLENGNRKKVRRWTYRMPKTVNKNLWEQFDVQMGYNRARDFINEVVKWDGNINKRTGQYYYSSTSKNNVDFVSAVAVQAGFETNQTVQVDHRSNSFHDVHRLFLLDKTSTNCRKMKKERISIDEYVYCVKVPSSYFVARTNGFAFITGNCQDVKIDAGGMYLKFFEQVGITRYIGLTATPFKQRQKYCKQGKFLEYTTSVSLVNRFPPIKGKYNPQFAWGKILYKIEMKDLQDMGYLCPIKYYTEMPQATLRLNSTGGDYAKADIEEFGIQSWNRILTVVTRLVRAKNPKRVLVFAPSVKASQSVSQALIERGISADHVDGKTPKKERDEKIARFRSGETQVMCNCQCLTAGFDLPALDTIVYAMPTLSPSRWIQSIGRCARIDPDNPNKVSEVYDLVGCCLTMGRPETFRIVKEDGFKDMLISERGRIDNVPLATFRIPLQKKQKLDEEYTIWKRD